MLQMMKLKRDIVGGATIRGLIAFVGMYIGGMFGLCSGNSVTFLGGE